MRTNKHQKISEKDDTKKVPPTASDLCNETFSVCLLHDSGAEMHWLHTARVSFSSALGKNFLAALVHLDQTIKPWL